MRKTKAFGEFIVLMALLNAMTALATDATLPAMGVIGSQLGIDNANDAQLVISVLFAGMAVGQVFYGPLSDSFGRRPAIFVGLGIFMVGSLLSYLANTLDMMLIGRFLQGLGSASTKIVSMALIRDRYEGREMAQVLSFIMSVFILVPSLAPALGQGVMNLWGWRAIFGLFMVVALVAWLWFGLRQEETLKEKRPFSASSIYHGVVLTCKNPTSLGYTVILGVVFGAFMAYLELAQPIFQEVYGSGEAFVIYFAVFALSLGVAAFVNARLVMRLGMRRLSAMALGAISLLSLLFLPVTLYYDGVPPFAMFMAYGMAVLFFIGLTIGNLNAMAMEPLGKIAGVGAAVVGSISTFIAVPVGVLLGRFYEGDIIPIVAGYAMLASIALLLFMRIREESIEMVEA